jgi:hypothetical protein
MSDLPGERNWPPLPDNVNGLADAWVAALDLAGVNWDTYAVGRPVTLRWLRERFGRPPVAPAVNGQTT